MAGDGAGGAGGAGGAHGKTTAANDNNAGALSGAAGGPGIDGAASTTMNSFGGGGGGGGAGGYGLVVTGGVVITNSASITGGKGGNGGSGGANFPGSNKPGHGGDAGGGGVGIEFTALNSTLNNNGGTIQGGDGGNGGAGLGTANFLSGTGGLGGAGVLGSSTTITNSGIIAGGAGGETGIPALNRESGRGGDGIAGDNNTITNSGTIRAGDGGPADGTGSFGQSKSGDGGNAISGSGLNIVNSGTIAGGVAGAVTNGATAGTDGKAIVFTGGNNRLEIWSTSIITGDVIATAPGTNTLALGGTANGNFDASLIGPNAPAQYQAFTQFEVTAQKDTTIWTLTKQPTQTTPWTLTKGVLSVAASASLGPIGLLPLTFNGGTLQVTGTAFTDFGARPIGWTANGGGFDIVEAATTFTVSKDLKGGPLKVNPVGGQGTLVLTGTNTVTGTTISAGTLQLGDNTKTGSIVGDVANDGTLAFKRSNTYQFDGLISGSGAVTQLGTGTTILTADNSYSGGTTITAGTLQVGNGGGTGSLGSGPVVDDSALVFNRSGMRTRCR